jgi:hypothetical protein
MDLLSNSSLPTCNSLRNNTCKWWTRMPWVSEHWLIANFRRQIWANEARRDEHGSLIDYFCCTLAIQLLLTLARETQPAAGAQFTLGCTNWAWCGRRDVIGEHALVDLLATLHATMDESQHADSFLSTACRWPIGYCNRRSLACRRGKQVSRFPQWRSTRYLKQHDWSAIQVW